MEECVVTLGSPYYPACPEDLECTQEEWEAYCRDMEEMRREYERLVFGDELESPV